MKTGYLTVVRYIIPSSAPRVRFWETKEEAERYRSQLLLCRFTWIDSIEIHGPVVINPAWINANGLILQEDFKSINIGPLPNEM